MQMQLSEKYRRGVVIPLTDAAVMDLDRETFDETTRVHVVEIVSQCEFDDLWKTGFFEAVNEQTGCLVDDYEEEVIPPDMVSTVRKIAESYLRSGAGGVAGPGFFTALVGACTLAERDARPMYFVL